MKICPECGLQAQDDASECVQCKHRYGTKSPPAAPPQTQRVAPQAPPQSQAGAPHGPFTSGPTAIPPAPEPPTIFDRVLNPFVAMKYRAELLAYMNATGSITDEDRKRVGKSMTFFFIALGLFLLIVTGDIAYMAVRTQQGYQSTLDQMRKDRERAQRQPAGGPSN